MAFQWKTIGVAIFFCLGLDDGQLCVAIFQDGRLAAAGKIVCTGPH